jgi:hypothetical protein
VALVYVVNHVKDFVMLYLTTFCNLCLFSLLLLCLMNNVNIFGLLRLNYKYLLVIMQLVFTSYTVDDEDYEGYEYSLFGQFSEVRVVYLNRFVQEVIYF